MPHKFTIILETSNGMMNVKMYNKPCHAIQSSPVIASLRAIPFEILRRRGLETKYKKCVGGGLEEHKHLPALCLAKSQVYV